MPGLKMNLNCPRRLAVYAVFDVLDTMGAEYARSMVGDIQAKVKVLGKTSGYAFAVTEQSRIPPSFTRLCPVRRQGLRRRANSLPCNI